MPTSARLAHPRRADPRLVEPHPSQYRNNATSKVRLLRWSRNRKPETQSTNFLFVSNVNDNVTEQLLREEFSCRSRIVSVTIPTLKDQSTGLASILLPSRTNPDSFVKAFHGTSLCGNRLNVVSDRDATLFANAFESLKNPSKGDKDESTPATGATNPEPVSPGLSVATPLEVDPPHSSSPPSSSKRPRPDRAANSADERRHDASRARHSTTSDKVQPRHDHISSTDPTDTQNATPGADTVKCKLSAHPPPSRTDQHSPQQCSRSQQRSPRKNSHLRRSDSDDDMYRSSRHRSPQYHRRRSREDDRYSYDRYRSYERRPRYSYYNSYRDNYERDSYCRDLEWDDRRRERRERQERSGRHHRHADTDSDYDYDRRHDSGRWDSRDYPSDLRRSRYDDYDRQGPPARDRSRGSLPPDDAVRNGKWSDDHVWEDVFKPALVIRNVPDRMDEVDVCEHYGDFRPERALYRDGKFTVVFRDDRDRDDAFACARLTLAGAKLQVKKSEHLAGRRECSLGASARMSDRDDAYGGGWESSRRDSRRHDRDSRYRDYKGQERDDRDRRSYRRDDYDTRDESPRRRPRRPLLESARDDAVRGYDDRYRGRDYHKDDRGASPDDLRHRRRGLSADRDRGTRGPAEGRIQKEQKCRRRDGQSRRSPRSEEGGEGYRWKDRTERGVYVSRSDRETRGREDSHANTGKDASERKTGKRDDIATSKPKAGATEKASGKLSHAEKVVDVKEGPSAPVVESEDLKPSRPTGAREAEKPIDARPQRKHSMEDVMEETMGIVFAALKVQYQKSQMLQTHSIVAKTVKGFVDAKRKEHQETQQALKEERDRARAAKAAELAQRKGMSVVSTPALAHLDSYLHGDLRSERKPPRPESRSMTPTRKRPRKSRFTKSVELAEDVAPDETPTTALFDDNEESEARSGKGTKRSGKRLKQSPSYEHLSLSETGSDGGKPSPDRGRKKSVETLDSEELLGPQSQPRKKDEADRLAIVGDSSFPADAEPRDSEVAREAEKRQSKGSSLKLHLPPTENGAIPRLVIRPPKAPSTSEVVHSSPVITTSEDSGFQSLSKNSSIKKRRSEDKSKKVKKRRKALDAVSGEITVAKVKREQEEAAERDRLMAEVGLDEDLLEVPQLSDDEDEVSDSVEVRKTPGGESDTPEAVEAPKRAGTEAIATASGAVPHGVDAVKEPKSDLLEGSCARERMYFRNQSKRIQKTRMRNGQVPSNGRQFRAKNDFLRNGCVAGQSSRQCRQETRIYRKGVNLINPKNDLIALNSLQQRRKKVYFKKSTIHGMGLFADEVIDPGEFIIEYVGEIIRGSVADLREKVYKRQGMGDSYLFRLTKDLVIDATRRGGIARFINHSCGPNVIARMISVEGVRKIVFYSKRCIKVDEELTYDYKFEYEAEDKKIPCLCGASSCRRFLNYKDDNKK